MPNPSAGPARRAVLGRIRAALRTESYLVHADGAPAEQRPALERVSGWLGDPELDPGTVRTRIRQLNAAGRLDRPMTLSALSVLAASPRVRDYAEALRLTGQQELAALDEGGPALRGRLASVARHRGVVFYLLGQWSHALDWFTRALERERSTENIGNVLAALLRLGDTAEAEDVVRSMRASLAPQQWDALRAHVWRDDDLVRLRVVLDEGSAESKGGIDEPWGGGDPATG